MDASKIGSRIKQFRVRQGLTQGQVAEYLELSRSQISHIEKGKRNIELEKLERLANLFGVELAAFFNEDEASQATELAFAFRSDDLNQSDLDQIAKFKKIVMNHLKMKRLINELESE